MLKPTNHIILDLQLAQLWNTIETETTKKGFFALKINLQHTFLREQKPEVIHFC